MADRAGRLLRLAAKSKKTGMRGLRLSWLQRLLLHCRIGRSKKQFQSKKEVLKRAGSNKRQAIANYQQYIQDGRRQGKRDDLIGGGLKRSAGGREGVKDLKKNKDFWRGDERILGDGEFVKDIMKKANEEIVKKEKIKREGWSCQYKFAICHRSLCVKPPFLVSVALWPGKCLPVYQP